MDTPRCCKFSAESIFGLKRSSGRRKHLLNEAFGDEIFKDIIEGIRDDEDGPQIDIAKNVLPNLDDQLILVTDNTLPSELNSERMLIAIRISDARSHRYRQSAKQWK